MINIGEHIEHNIDSYILQLVKDIRKYKTQTEYMDADIERILRREILDKIYIAIKSPL